MITVVTGTMANVGSYVTQNSFCCPWCHCKPPGWEKLKSGRLLPPVEAFVDFRVIQNAGRRGFRTEDSYKQSLSFLRPSKGRKGVAP